MNTTAVHIEHIKRLKSNKRCEELELDKPSFRGERQSESSNTFLEFRTCKDCTFYRPKTTTKIKSKLILPLITSCTTFSFNFLPDPLKNPLNLIRVLTLKEYFSHN